MEKNFVIARFKNKKLITQLFTVLMSFSIILMMVVSIVVSHQTTAAFFKNNNLVYSNTIDISMQTLDTLLAGYHDSLTHITYDATIIDFVVTPKPKDSIANYQVRSVLNSYCQENEALEEVFFYVKKADQVLTSNYETADLDHFREQELIRKHLAGASTTAILKSGRTTYLEMYQNQLYMVRDFPLNGERRLGTLYMKINPSILYRALSGSQTSFSSLFAYDQDWTPLFPTLTHYENLPPAILDVITTATDDGLATKHYDNRHYFFGTSDQANIRMVLSVDDSYFTPGYQMILKNSLPFFALILLLSTILSGCILFLTYRPVLKLTKIVSSGKSQMNQDKTENEWDYLTSHFLNISEQKHQLDQVLNNMIPKISKEFYFDLLNGKPMELPYIQNILTSINSPLQTDGTFEIIAVTFSESLEVARRTRIMKSFTDFLAEFTLDLGHYVIQQMDDSLYVAIVQFYPKTTALSLSRFEINIEQALFNRLKGNNQLAWIEFGPKCTLIQNISISYLECLQRQAQKKYPDSGNQNQKDPALKDSISFNFHYFQTQVKSMADFVMKGESSSALQKALQICKSVSLIKSTDEFCHAFEYYRMAFWDILNSFRITDSGDEELTFVFDKEYSFTADGRKTEDVVKYMERFCTAAITLLVEKYQKQQHKYLVKAKRYIESDYSNPDLSLNLLAEQCNTTTSYLSRLFKESFGINFVDYLNQYRIERAKELLQNSRTPIKEVAKITGFNSQQNFIRVFKRYSGMTPGQFKSTK